MRLAGTGELPPIGAACLEKELLEKRWQSLQSILVKLGRFKIRRLKLSEQSHDVLWAGDFVVSIELGQLKSRSVMEGWLLHLQICATDISPSRTIVISRSISKTKKNEFEIALQWSPLPAQEASEELEKLYSLAHQGLQDCWPIPPESGWALAIANRDNDKKGEVAFRQKWLGGFNSQGECERQEMKLCFGTKLETSDLLNSECFKEAYSALYKSIIKNLV